MTTEVLKKETAKYLIGQPGTNNGEQIQTWLSCPGDKKADVTERELIEKEIVSLVNAYATSSLFVAKPERWWKKIIASF